MPSTLKILQWVVFFLMITSCAVKREFTETVVDPEGPEHIWMKTTGDMNADGKTDMLVGGWKKGGLVAYLAPDWKKQSIVESVKISTDAEVRDIDNDGIADIVAVVDRAIACFSGPSWNVHLVDSIVAHDVEVHDFDNDGFPDVLARNQGAFGKEGGQTVYLYTQAAAGSWTRYEQSVPDGEGLEIADINSDGRMDFIANTHWYENTGDMHKWKEHKFSDSWRWPNTYIAVADINADGRIDILHSPAELAGSRYRISWFEAPEEPESLWKEHVVADTVETIVHSIGASDFDDDGRMDIVIAEMQQGADPDEVIVYFHERSEKWTRTVISTGGCHSMQIFDADDDGDVDIFGANFAENAVRLWVNGRRR